MIKQFVLAKCVGLLAGLILLQGAAFASTPPPAGSGHDCGYALRPTPSLGSAADQVGARLLLPTAKRVTFDGRSYCQYDGIVEGRTSTGAFRVPYRLSVEGHTRRNGTVVVEPPHIAGANGALERYLRPGLLFDRGFTHAAVGWSTVSFGPGFNFRILDPTVAGVFIKGGSAEENGRTDTEIVAEFARALSTDQQARSILGPVKRRYLVGFSDSSIPVMHLVTTGRGANVFDLALPFTTEGQDPQIALRTGVFPGKVIIVNSEFDDSGNLVDRGVVRDRYRFYAVAGTPHVPDFLDIADFTSRSTPASVEPALRAHFLQGDRWVREGTRPPASYHLRTSAGGEIERDANGNAIAVDTAGRRVPRLPFLELGEARFVTGFVGSYDHVKTYTELGFTSHRGYRAALDDKIAAYARAGYILKQDAAAIRARAALCGPLTFTQTYRDRYDNFVAITRCS